jgi:hypothetical protein
MISGNKEYVPGGDAASLLSRETVGRNQRNANFVRVVQSVPPLGCIDAVP